MSMLIRRGTIVRKTSTRKSSVRRTRSAGSTPSGGSIHGRTPLPLEDDVLHRCEVSSVPASPVAKLHHVHADPTNPSSSPGKASVITNSTIVSFDECRLSYKTSIERKQYTSSCDRASYSTGYSTQQDTALQIEEANKEAESVCDFVCTASRIVCSSTFMTAAVALSMIVPVVMIALGIKYLEDCPLEPRIPIYLLVGGSFGALKVALTLWRSLRRRQQGSVDNLYGMAGGLSTQTYRSMDIILSLFLLAWHVLGTVWVLGIWKPRFKPLLHRPTQYCDRSLYFFSVSVIAGVYAVLALLLLGIGCLTCVYRSNGSHRGQG